MSGWLESIGVTNTIADALLSRLRKQEGGDAPATERSFAQALGARGNRQIILLLPHTIILRGLSGNGQNNVEPI